MDKVDEEKRGVTRITMKSMTMEDINKLKIELKPLDDNFIYNKIIIDDIPINDDLSNLDEVTSYKLGKCDDAKEVLELFQIKANKISESMDCDALLKEIEAAFEIIEKSRNKIIKDSEMLRANAELYKSEVKKMLEFVRLIRKVHEELQER